jgi:hypothetical protein
MVLTSSPEAWEASGATGGASWAREGGSDYDRGGGAMQQPFE